MSPGDIGHNIIRSLTTGRPQGLHGHEIADDEQTRGLHCVRVFLINRLLGQFYPGVCDQVWEHYVLHEASLCDGGGDCIETDSPWCRESQCAPDTVPAH